MVDEMIMLVLIGVGLILIVSAFAVRTHPIFFVLMIILMSFFSWVAAIYANTYQEIAEHPDFSAYAEKLKMGYYVMRFLPSIIIFFALLISVIMATKG